MPCSCCVFNCTNRQTKDAKYRQISFHAFPKEKKRRDLWIAKVRRLDPITGDCWQPGPGAFVCSEHFLSTDFHYQWGRKLVKTDSVPTLFSYAPPKKRKLPKDRQAESVNAQVSTYSSQTTTSTTGDGAVEETDDSCSHEIVPLTRDIDHTYARVYVSGDWSAEVKQENLAVVKQEPDDDDESGAMCSVKNDLMPTEVDETQSHMQSVHASGKLSLVRSQKKYHIWINAGGSCVKVKTEADDVPECPHDDHIDRSSTGESSHGAETEADSSDVTQHPDGRLYICNKCGRCFASRYDLNRHMNIHIDKYMCPECGECYGNNSKLAVHRRIHSGEKPFECTVCSKRFTVSHHLVAHSRIHSGEKPYQCYVCDKAFRESGHLKRHMRVHTGYKPYKCSECNKSFSDLNSMHRHLS